jgi:hypothetical protein
VAGCAVLPETTLTSETPGVLSRPATPRMRIGSLPFPGLNTFYAAADPRDLGAHRYERWWEYHDGPDEIGHGILYTRRAGFLDLSHIRESMDIAKYWHDRIQESLADSKPGMPPAGGTFGLEWSATDYEVVVRVPGWWESLDASDRKAIAREAAIRQAQRMAVIVGAWHELGTWYGQMTIPPFPENGSAFTWDDSASHVVAAIVAARALRDDGARWNPAATRALREVLTELDVVDVDCESAAVERVHGRWWRFATAIRRDLDVGIGTAAKEPWLVPGPGCWVSPTVAASPLVLPEMTFAGRDLRELFEVRIRPPGWLMASALGCTRCPDALVNESQLLDAIERLRAEVKRALGPDADQP